MVFQDTQTIRPTVVDHMLEPDALRGSEWVYRHVVGDNGQAVDIRNMEQERRDALEEAQVRPTAAPFAVSTSQVQPPLASAPVPPAPLPAPTVAPSVPSGEPNWEAGARAAGWAPRSETSPSDRGPLESTSAPPQHWDDTRKEWVDNAMAPERSTEPVAREFNPAPPPTHVVPPPAEPPV